MVRYKPLPLSDGKQFKGRRIGFSFVISKVFSLPFLNYPLLCLKTFCLSHFTVLSVPVLQHVQVHRQTLLITQYVKLPQNLLSKGEEKTIKITAAQGPLFPLCNSFSFVALCQNLLSLLTSSIFMVVGQKMENVWNKSKVSLKRDKL